MAIQIDHRTDEALERIATALEALTFWKKKPERVRVREWRAEVLRKHPTPPIPGIQ